MKLCRMGPKANALGIDHERRYKQVHHEVHISAVVCRVQG